MRTTTAIFLLTRLLTLTSPLPLPSALSPRTQYCANAPTILAGSLLPRTPTPPNPTLRFVGPYVWCAVSSRTYIITSISPLVPRGPFIHSSLQAIYDAVSTHIHQVGDGPIPHGVFLDNNPVTRISLEIANVDNHQTTWGFFASALTALGACMQQYGWGEAAFHVYDVENLVGAGTVGEFGEAWGAGQVGGNLAWATGSNPTV